MNQSSFFDDNENIVVYSQENQMIGLLIFSKKHLELKQRRLLIFRKV